MSPKNKRKISHLPLCCKFNIRNKRFWKNQISVSTSQSAGLDQMQLWRRNFKHSGKVFAKSCLFSPILLQYYVLCSRQLNTKITNWQSEEIWTSFFYSLYFTFGFTFSTQFLANAHISMLINYYIWVRILKNVSLVLDKVYTKLCKNLVEAKFT